MDVIGIILMIVFCAFASAFLYGIWLIENDQDEFRRKHGYKPKYHYLRKEEHDENQDQ